MNKLPQLLTDFRIFLGDGSEAIGHADLTLPDIAWMEESVKGSGVAGEMSLPVVGQTQAMSTEIKWNTISGQCMELLAPKATMITARGSQQVFNRATGRSDSQPVTVIMKVIPKQVGLGKFEKAASTDSGNTFEVIMIKVLIDGQEYCHIDKVNYICRIDGIDYLAEVRANMGL